MTVWHRVAGDLADTIDVPLEGIDDLTAFTSGVAYVRRHLVVVTLAAITVPDPNVPTLRVPLNPWLTTAAPGVWRIRYRLTFTDTSQRTWPSGRPDRIVVEANPAAA